jgi:enoyl-CoA hydratase
LAFVNINKPPVNSFDYEVVQQLSVTLDKLAGDGDIHVIILTGTEETFATGVDVKSLDQKITKEVVLQVAEVQRKIEDSLCPVIAAINCDAVGGGCGLAMTCDIRIASEKAKFGQPGLAEGFMPGGGETQRLSRLVGKSKAMELILTSEIIDAKEACRIGLVNQVVPHERLMVIVKEMAQNLAHKGPIALRYAKEAIHKGMDMTLEQGLRLEADLYFLLHTTKDRTEGIKAHHEKRVPHFEGK